MSEAYFSRDMMDHYAGSVPIVGYLYGFSGRILTAMRFDTGEVARKHRSVGEGQIIYADGMSCILGVDAVVGLVDPAPGGGTRRSLGSSWSVATIRLGRSG